MIHRQAKLSAEELQNLAKLESSAQHWAIQACNLTMQQKQAQAQFEAITAARNQLLSKVYKEAGVDENTIQDIRISMNKETKEGLIDIVCVEPPAPPEAAMVTPPQVHSNGVPVPAPSLAAEAKAEPSKDAALVSE